ncbi:MAG TPA: peptidylprolyl isomerase [Telluria sp.]|nr:peptidylprolyl isomerase [Telluria sp.]
MTFKPASLLLALLAIAAAPAFAQNVAVVNGKPIPMSRLEAAVKSVVSQGREQDSPQLRTAFKNELIAREVLMQEAEKLGFSKNADVRQALDNARQSIVVDAMVRDYVSKNPVSDADIKAEYDKFKAQVGDKEYHVRHILTENEADAKAAIAKIKGGQKFEEVAKTVSKDTGSAANGGDLDWAAPAAFPKEFADAVVSLQKGAVTENPVRTQAGYHVVKVDDVRAAKLPSLDEVKPQVAESLIQKKLQAYQEQLVKKAKVQ